MFVPISDQSLNKTNLAFGSIFTKHALSGHLLGDKDNSENPNLIKTLRCFADGKILDGDKLQCFRRIGPNHLTFRVVAKHLS